jgi:hypothetical protein
VGLRVIGVRKNAEENLPKKIVPSTQIETMKSVESIIDSKSMGVSTETF